MNALPPLLKVGGRLYWASPRISNHPGLYVWVGRFVCVLNAAIALQLLIAAFSGAALVLLSSPEPALARWGWVVGLAAQPAWLLATLRARQWGMFALAWVYLALHLRGVWNNFF